MNTFRAPVITALAATALWLAGCSKAPESDTPKIAVVAPHPAATATATDRHADGHAAGGIAWIDAATDAEVDSAFAMAKSQGKPVFVYWGAKWCPPCNQVKATLFNRQDFIERTRAFVPVYVDGDSPGAQKIGARFHVSGYPTMVLFSPRGEEVTRLPGEVEPVRYTQVMTLGMNAARPVKAVLADALAGGRDLTANDWRLLAFYSFDTDQQQLVAKDRLPSTLATLAAACPPTQVEAATRLRLKALAAVDTEAGAAADPPARDAAAQPAVLALLDDAARAREQTDMLTSSSAEIVRALSAKATPERRRLIAGFDRALKRLEADTTLSRADRMQALIAQVELARIDEHEADTDTAAAAGKPMARTVRVALPAALLADVREQVARADREITDGYERQAVITAAAYLLEHAGLGADSDTLLKANLARSHSPYYLMSELASNAKKRGDKAEALDWYRQAFEKSEGPATRLQWGGAYVAALVELAPGDEAKIEQATARLFTEAATQPDAFYERSGRSLARVGTRLQSWNKGGAHAAAFARLRVRLDALCAAPGLGATERVTCAGLLSPSARAST
ncbi:MAG: thioredoxin fold domain-containing protein [Caldimonas sp.]